MKKNKRIILGKIVNHLLYGIIIFFALSVIFSFFSIPGGIRVFNVMSGSMEPAIKTGSLVFVKEKEDYKIGDIITFKKVDNNKETVTHRVVEIEEQNQIRFYRVKGDANESSDSQLIGEYNIVGKVLFSVPFLGYPIKFAKTPLGIIILVVVPATIIIYEEIGNIRNEVAKIKKLKSKKHKRVKKKQVKKADLK